MTIYLSTAIQAQYLPYTYRIGWPPAQTGLDYWVYYYGSKYAKDAHPDLFWVDYFTSSEYVTEKRKEWGEPELKEIRKIWQALTPSKETAELVTGYERRVLTWLNAAGRPDYLNKRNNASSSWNKDMVSVKDSTGETFYVPVDDERYLTGKLVGVAAGRVNVVDENGNRFQVDLTDPRWLSGELTVGTGFTPGTITAKDRDGNTFRAPTSDPRFKTGEIKSIITGKVAVRDKSGNNHLMDKTDPRLNEMKGVRSGLMTAKDADGNHITVSTDDPRLNDGTLTSIYKGLINAKDRLGRRFKTTKDDPRWSTGEIAGIARKNWDLFKCVRLE